MDTTTSQDLSPITVDGVLVVDLPAGTIAIPSGPLTADAVRRRMTIVDGLEQVLVVGETRTKMSSLGDHVICYEVRIGDEEFNVYNEPYAQVIADVAPTIDAQVA